MNIKKEVYLEVEKDLELRLQDLRYKVWLRKRDIKKLSEEQTMDKRKLVALNELIRAYKGETSILKGSSPYSFKVKTKNGNKKK